MISYEQNKSNIIRILQNIGSTAEPLNKITKANNMECEINVCVKKVV